MLINLVYYVYSSCNYLAISAYNNTNSKSLLRGDYWLKCITFPFPIYWDQIVALEESCLMVSLALGTSCGEIPCGQSWEGVKCLLSALWAEGEHLQTHTHRPRWYKIDTLRWKKGFRTLWSRKWAFWWYIKCV